MEAEQKNNKTEYSFGKVLGYITGVVIACCLNAIILAAATRIVLWII